MEALKLQTVDDLLDYPDERVELIHGEIVKRPMARFIHGQVQSGLADEMAVFKRRRDADGWWIITEVSVRYGEHYCPTHDLAGWRKERMPTPPAGVTTMTPDWVCEITSPGHERKDVFTHFMALQRYGVPFYWVISPEDKTLIAYQLVGEHYHVVFSQECPTPEQAGVFHIPPFAEEGIDLGYVFFG